MQYNYGIDSMFLLTETDHPELAFLITTFKNWNKRGDADSKGAAIFLLSYLHLSSIITNRTGGQITTAEAIGTFEYAKEYMEKYFGRTDIVLGDLQKLVRGDKEFPLGGFPDLLSPQWTEPFKDGKLKSIGGDGLIMFVRFPKQGLPIIETVNMYGASADPASKHFSDQVDMYLHQQTKKMTLDKAIVYKNAERIYHPQ